MLAGERTGLRIAHGLEATRVTDRVPGASSIADRWNRPLERRGARAVLIARTPVGPCAVRMTDGFALALALVVLAATLAVAVARPPYLSEAVAASGGAVLLVIVGAIGLSGAGDALRDLGPTVGFLAAMLLIAEGCRREGLFDAMGAVMARGSGGSPQRLLAFVFVIAAAITAVLSLDATIVLLTPVVFATAARMRTSAKPHVYACAHLANSASLLLPVSNLTNLLAFHASKLSFLRFAALMVLPTIAAVGVEWVVFRRFFAVDLKRPRHAGARPARPALPRFAVAVLALTLAGFALSSVVGIEPVWFAAAGAAAITIPRARPQNGDPGRARAGSGARLSDLRPRARGDRAGGERQRPGHRGARRAPDRRFAARPARDRRAERDLREPRQQPAGDADARPRGGRRRHRTGPRDADRRQRRP